MLEREKALEAELDKVLPEYRQSARNLIHYLTLRSIDLRALLKKHTLRLLGQAPRRAPGPHHGHPAL